MKYVFGVVISLSITISCNVLKNQPNANIGSGFYIEHQCKKNQLINVYRLTTNNKRLNGNIIRKNKASYDDTLYFTCAGNFEKGILNGIDSIFINNQLVGVKNYRQGILQGEQIEIKDSFKIISHFENGAIQGYQSTYINGNLSCNVFYNHGVKDSIEYYYDNSGNIVTVIKYAFYQQENWRMFLDLDNFDLISMDNTNDTLSIKMLNIAEYKGTIVYYSYDPKGVSKTSNSYVLHESLIQNSICADDNLYNRGYFYIIDENNCIICDYIDKDGIWVAYMGLYGSQNKYYRLIKK